MARRQVRSMILSCESEARKNIFMFGSAGTFRPGALCLLVLSLLASPARSLAQVPQPVKRPVVVSDAIHMTRLADDFYFGGGSAKGRVASFSPDGKRFVVVLRKGNLETNTNEFLLYLFSKAEAFHPSNAKPLLQMSSSSNRDAIHDVKWLDDNETIAFAGENPGELSQIYTYDVRTRHLKKRTDSPTAVMTYDVSSDSQEIVFTAVPSARRTKDAERELRPEVLLDSQALTKLVEGNLDEPSEDQLFLQKSGQSTRPILLGENIVHPGHLSISPDGRYVLVETFVRDLPKSWVDYQDAFVHKFVSAKSQWSPLRRYLLVDTKQNTVTPLIDAPMDPMKGFDPPIWTATGHSVFLMRTYLPLDVSDSSEREARAKTAYDIELELPSKEFRKISTAERPAQHSTNPEVDVTLEEDLNTPPKIYVSSATNHKKMLLLDLNPRFADLKFGKVEIINWPVRDGKEVQGGLYLPPDYSPGQRYPLVIQTHGFHPNRFSIDGRLDWSSAFAAQPLAAKGIVVLQAAELADSTIEEGPREMARYEGAIEYLDKRGFIDPHKVGIVGFSGTVYHVAYTLTHSKYTFSAAILVDGADGGYFQYICFPWVAVQYDAQNGGPPFGAGIKTWLENSPGFNLDKVQTPVRLVALGRGSVLVGWEWFSGLSLLHKPVEFVELPNASHLIVEPLERQAAQEGMVDWFRFWLKDEEDPDPTKVERYARWRELRNSRSKENQQR